MKHTEKNLILQKSTDLMTKLDYKILEHLRGEELNTALITTYNNSKNELLIHIREQLEHIGTIEVLTQCFVDACFGFGALGMRQDMLHKKLLGAKKRGQEAMLDAIIKDTKPDDTMRLEWLSCESDREHQDAINLCSEAFDSGRISISSEDVDAKALAFIYLLDYVLGNGIKLDLTSVALDFQYFSCLKYVIGKNQADISLAGYFDDNDDYKLQGADTDFIKIFANRLETLLSQAGSKRSEHFKSLQIKEYLQELLVQAYAGNTLIVAPLTMYTEIERLLAVGEHITQDVYEDATYSRRFAIKRIYSSKGISYELNTDGLQGLADLLEENGLCSLQEVNTIVSMIRAIGA